jgi:L,D-peptidoglycan transpeptidase YkuD (ErfK/YbiS/YcfS/YnhG family)
VPDTWAALTVVTVPTNAGGEDAGASGWGSVVVTGVRVAAPAAGGVVEGVVGETVELGIEVVPCTFAGACVWPPAIRGVLEHAASNPQVRRPVVHRTARWRLGRGTVAHHSPPRRSTLLVGLGMVPLLVLASCGARAHQAAFGTKTSTTSTVPTTVAPRVPATSAPTVPAAAPTTVPATAPVEHTAPAPSPATTAPRPTTPAPAAPLLVTRLVGVGSATQVIAVSASGYGQTVATLTAYHLDGAGWHEVFGPWQADVGYAGFAPPAQKREGDGRTPSGSFGFGFFFGVLADPGVQFPYRQVSGRNIVWDDDPASPLYNQWVDTTMTSAGIAPEAMDQTPAYDYGAVIDYNTGPTVPGDGSAIFFHVSGGGPTAGCVSLPTGELLSVLRWLSPAAQPRIIMGTAATISP